MLSALDFSFWVTSVPEKRGSTVTLSVVTLAWDDYFSSKTKKMQLSAGLGRLSPDRDTQQGARGTRAVPQLPPLTWRTSGQGPGEDCPRA